MGVEGSTHYRACTAKIRCEDPSAWLRLGRDDNIVGNLELPDKLKFDKPMKKNRTISVRFFKAELTENAQQETCRDGGADDACHIGAHSVHQQEVGGVRLLTFRVCNTGCHRNGRNTGRADERVDLALGDPAHDLTEDKTADCAAHKGNKTYR